MMIPDEPGSVHTRPSLLTRLKTGDDAESWEEFYRVYGKVVRDFAIQVGLTDGEADEVVQETAIAVARHLPDFHYDPKVCRFKTWLLTQASWRIKDQIKKRAKEPHDSGPSASGRAGDTGSDTTHTATMERVADPRSVSLDELFEEEWRKNLFDAALDRVKEKFSLKQFQIFDLLVRKEWPAGDVARSLGVSLANVYVIRHRISVAVQKEVRRLERAI